MIYSKIITFLFVILLLYYASMIALDLHKAKRLKEQESENVTENDIDISDEAKNFKAILISRDNPQKTIPDSSESTGIFANRYKNEATMTGGIPVEVIAEKIKNSDAGLPQDLGDIIYKCHAA